MRHANLWRLFICAAALAVAADGAPAAVRQVGEGRLYRYVSQALAAAAPGDIIEIDSGEYRTTDGWCEIYTSNLTFRGVGPTRPIMDGRNGAMRQMGYFLVSATNTTFENLEIRNVRVSIPDGANGSGIRMNGTHLTVRNCVFRDCDNGIMGGYNSGSDILVENCEFNHCGHIDLITGQPDSSSGYSHNMYIGTSRKFTLRYCYSHGTAEGHEVKSRALTNEILYNLLWSEGTGSRELQIAQGGTAYIIGNVIRQGANSHNADIIAYGGEGNNANPYLYVVNNTLINERAEGAIFLNVNNNPTTAVLQNNIIQRFGNETIVGGSYAGKVTQTSNWITDNAWLRDVAGHNYRLTAASLGALNAGTAPGTGRNNYALTPGNQYVHAYAAMVRPVDAVLDIGAYEYVPNQSPTVSLGDDLDVYEGQMVNLHAAAVDPDGDVLIYTWTQISGPGITLTGATTDLAFAAPVVANLAEASQAFQVDVSDGQLSASDSVGVRTWMAGDCTRDDAVDVTDLLTVAGAWDSGSGDANYDAACDFNGDGAVDVADLLALAGNWDRTLQ